MSAMAGSIARSRSGSSWVETVSRTVSRTVDAAQRLPALGVAAHMIEVSGTPRGAGKQGRSVLRRIGLGGEIWSRGECGSSGSVVDGAGSMSCGVDKLDRAIESSEWS